MEQKILCKQGFFLVHNSMVRSVYYLSTQNGIRTTLISNTVPALQEAWRDMLAADDEGIASRAQKLRLWWFKGLLH